MTAKKRPPSEGTRAFGAEVARRRGVLGWTQEELGKRAGLQAQRIRGVERAYGATSLAVAAKIAKAFGVRLAELFPSKGLSPAALELARRFDELENPAQREAILKLISETARVCPTPTKRLR